MYNYLKKFIGSSISGGIFCQKIFFFQWSKNCENVSPNFGKVSNCQDFTFREKINKILPFWVKIAKFAIFGS